MVAAVLWMTLRGQAAEVMVFAAASLSGAMKQIAAEYQKTSGDRIVFNFGASGVLARQIEAGAPADIFFSADEARLDALEREGLIVTNTRISLLGNTLVIITPAGASPVRAASGLTNSTVARVAIGEVKTVPAGTYARAWLEKEGLWKSVEPRTVPCENVRAVLAAVESGNADAGIVYKTDAMISKKVSIGYQVPTADSPPIIYPAALVAGSPQPEAARRLLGYLETDAAVRVFRNAGFSLPSRR